jgi:hypothetical protein
MITSTLRGGVRGLSARGDDSAETLPFGDAWLFSMND